jgi:hypothetical protein
MALEEGFFRDSAEVFRNQLPLPSSCWFSVILLKRFVA